MRPRDEEAVEVISRNTSSSENVSSINLPHGLANASQITITDGQRSNELSKVLHERHVNFMAFSLTVGVGLFVNTGRVLATAGPAGATLSYLISGIIMWCVMSSLGEMTALLPVVGSITEFPSRFLDKSVGFATGWMYWFTYIITVAGQANIAANLTRYKYSPDQSTLASGDECPNITNEDGQLHLAIYIGLFLAVMFVVNLTPTRWFGEIEYFVGVTKMVSLVALILAMTILAAHVYGGTRGVPPGTSYWNGQYSFFNNHYTVGKHHFYGSSARFLTLWTSITYTTFAAMGVETTSVAAAETNTESRFRNRNPVTLKVASRKIMIRMVTLYTLAVFTLSFVVRSDDKHFKPLGHKFCPSDVSISPFSIAFADAGRTDIAKGLNRFFIFSSISSGLNGLWLSSRILHALAVKNRIWPIALRQRFKETRYGVPINAMIFSSLFSLIAFTSAPSRSSNNSSPNPGRAFDALATNATDSVLIVYIVICATYDSYYRKINEACRSTSPPDERFLRSNRLFPYKSSLQPWRARIGMVACSFMLLFNGWKSFLTPFDAVGFVASYIGILAFVILVIGFKIYTHGINPRNWAVDQDDHWSDMEHIPDEPGAKFDTLEKINVDKLGLTWEEVQAVGKWIWVWLK